MKLDELQRGLVLESSVNYLEWMQILKKQQDMLRIYATRCSSALTLIEPLYHGKTTTSDSQVFVQKVIRQNRKNLTTPTWFSTLFNRMVEKKFGAVGLLRSASVFLTSDDTLADMFGDVCFALPFNETKFLVYKGVRDTSSLAFQIAMTISRLMYGVEQATASLMAVNSESNLDAVMKLINNEGFFDAVYKDYEKNFFFFNNVAELAKFVEQYPVCEIMAGGVSYIPLVKVPSGIDKVKAWNELRLAIQQSTFATT